MDQLVADAGDTRAGESADTRVAFSNGWRYGVPVPPGPVTVNDLWNIVPPNPPVSLAELTGREMWKMMEENLEHTLATDPYKQMGGYVKRCLGVNIYIKAENPPGSRIQQFFVNGDAIEADRHYAVAFITSQGVPKKYGSNRRELPISAIDALRRYFSNHPKVNADFRSRGRGMRSPPNQAQTTRHRLPPPGVSPGAPRARSEADVGVNEVSHETGY